MFLIQKYTQYKAAQAEQSKRKVTEKELSQLNHKIDKLLSKLDEHEPEIAANQDEECVVCVNAKATMETYPCGHRVICRKCFVKTIQMAVAQRLLPLRCVICRAKILRLKHLNGLTPVSSGGSSGSGSSFHHWYNVPQSASLYSVTSNTSAVSGVSSASASSCSSSSYKTCASSFSFRKSHSAYSKMGYEPLRSSSPSPTRRSASNQSTAKTGLATIIPKKDNRVSPSEPVVVIPPNPPKGKLKLVQDFQREFRASQMNCQPRTRLSSSASTHSAMSSASTRIKCAKHLVNQAQSSYSGSASSSSSTPQGDLSKIGRNHQKGCVHRKTSSAGPGGRGSTSSSQSCPSFKQLRVSSANGTSGTDKLNKLDSTNTSQRSINPPKQNVASSNTSTIANKTPKLPIVP